MSSSITGCFTSIFNQIDNSNQTDQQLNNNDQENDDEKVHRSEQPIHQPLMSFSRPNSHDINSSPTIGSKTSSRPPSYYSDIDNQSTSSSSPDPNKEKEFVERSKKNNNIMIEENLLSNNDDDSIIIKDEEEEEDDGLKGIDKDQIRFIEDEIESLSDRLRELSLKMFENPELAMKEFKTHDLIASFMETQPGWKVKRHAYGIETAVEAKFKYGEGGQTIGFNSEMDALPGIGHACGHPLICITGLAAAISTAKALQKTKTSGTVILLGTPAEETIGGKILLIERGAYKSMNACLMLHPAPYGGLLDMLAISQIKVEYFGKTAHAAGAPWEAINALDAAVSAYNNISLLRQQIHPTQRVHGIIQGSENWVQNVIPDYAYLTYDIRAKTKKEMRDLKSRVIRCFEASSESSGCKIKIEDEMEYDDLINNLKLGSVYKTYMESFRKIDVPLDGPILGSTDFGNVSYKVPSIHPLFKIPTKPGQGNHTIGFRYSSSDFESHRLSLESAKGIAIVGWKVLIDEKFKDLVYRNFLDDVKRKEKKKLKIKKLKLK